MPHAMYAAYAAYAAYVTHHTSATAVPPGAGSRPASSPRRDFRQKRQRPFSTGARLASALPPPRAAQTSNSGKNGNPRQRLCSTQIPRHSALPRQPRFTNLEFRQKRQLRSVLIRGGPCLSGVGRSLRAAESCFYPPLESRCAAKTARPERSSASVSWYACPSHSEDPSGQFTRISGQNGQLHHIANAPHRHERTASPLPLLPPPLTA